MKLTTAWPNDGRPDTFRDPGTAPGCRFITSFGGAARCQDPPYLLGFCAFHFVAFERGEIDEAGRFSDLLDDQRRRREINYHGLALPDDVKPNL